MALICQLSMSHIFPGQSALARADGLGLLFFLCKIINKLLVHTIP